MFIAQRFEKHSSRVITFLCLAAAKDATMKSICCRLSTSLSLPCLCCCFGGQADQDSLLTGNCTSSSPSHGCISQLPKELLMTNAETTSTSLSIPLLGTLHTTLVSATDGPLKGDVNTEIRWCAPGSLSCLATSICGRRLHLNGFPFPLCSSSGVRSLSCEFVRMI